jgi:hypothetical protein
MHLTHLILSALVLGLTSAAAITPKLPINEPCDYPHEQQENCSEDNFVEECFFEKHEYPRASCRDQLAYLDKESLENL